MEALPADVQVILPDQPMPASCCVRINSDKVNPPIATSLALPRPSPKLPRPRVPDIFVTHFDSATTNNQQ